MPVPKTVRKKRDFRGERVWLNADVIKDLVSVHFGLTDKAEIKAKLSELSPADIADIVAEQTRRIKYGGATPANTRSPTSPPYSATPPPDPVPIHDDPDNGSTSLNLQSDEFGEINADDLSIFD